MGKKTSLSLEVSSSMVHSESFVLGWPTRTHGGKGKKVQLHLETLSLQRAGFLVILLVRRLPLPWRNFTPENRLGRPHGTSVCFTFQSLGTVKLVFWLKFCISFSSPFSVISGYLISTNHPRGGGEGMWCETAHRESQPSQKREQLWLGPCDNWNLFCSPRQALKPEPLKDRRPRPQLGIKATSCPGWPQLCCLWGLGQVLESFLALVTWLGSWGRNAYHCHWSWGYGNENSKSSEKPVSGGSGGTLVTIS